MPACVLRIEKSEVETRKNIQGAFPRNRISKTFNDDRLKEKKKERERDFTSSRESN